MVQQPFTGHGPTVLAIDNRSIFIAAADQLRLTAITAKPCKAFLTALFTHNLKNIDHLLDPSDREYKPNIQSTGADHSTFRFVQSGPKLEFKIYNGQSTGPDEPA